MATVTWIGAVSTSANTDANWSTGSKPVAGDVAVFDNNAIENCNWDIGTPSTALSVDEIIIESTFKDGSVPRTLTLDTKPRIKGLFIDGTIQAGVTGEINFESGFGSYKTYNNRYVLIGDNAIFTNITMTMRGTGVKFDDGQHPTVTLLAGTYGPDYETPTGTSGKASFTSLTIDATATSFAPLAAVDANDRKKVFDFTAFTCDISGFDAGESTFEFLALSGGFNLPVRTATFTPVYRKVVLKAATAGHKVMVADNSILVCDELEIQDGCMMIGPQGTDKQGADIRVTLPPKIRGSWSFGQISNGLYRSPKLAFGPSLSLATSLAGKITIKESTYSSSSPVSDDTTIEILADSVSTSDAMFRINTDSGFLRIGPQNSGYCHFYTDRALYYFNKPIHFDGGGAIASYNDDFIIQSDLASGSSTTRIHIEGGVDATLVGIGNGAPTATLDVTGDVRFRASVEICTSDPAPATGESGTIYQFTKGSAGVFTLPADPPVGTQFVLVNGDGQDIVITRPHSSVKINGATADKTNTTAYAATSIVAVVQNGNSSEWLVFGGI